MPALTMKAFASYFEFEIIDLPIMRAVLEGKRSCMGHSYRIKLKGIGSQDFNVCFLLPLDSSDIASPDRNGWVFLNKVDFVGNFYFSGLDAGCLPSERISAL
jgi:hypothetical protein